MTFPEHADIDPFSAQPPTETWILNDAERRVADAFVPSPAVVEAQRPALWNTVERALATAVSPHERRSLVLTGRLLEWQLFNPTAPLPPGLVMSADEQGRSYISFDERERLGDECAFAAAERLADLGLDDIAASVQQDFNARKAEITTTIDASVRTMPEFALLQSFDIQLPAEITEQPLPPHVRDEREQQILDYARTTHRIPDWERISTKLDPTAAKTASRSIQYLDEQTMPLRTETASDEDARTRAKAYFEPLVAAAVADQYGQALTGYRWANNELWLVTDQESTGHEAIDVMPDVADRVAEGIDNTSSTARLSVRSALVDRFFDRLYDPTNTVPYKELLEEAVAELTEELFTQPRETLTHFLYSEHDDHSRLYRFAPTGEFVHRDVIDHHQAAHRVCDFYLAGRQPGFADRRTLDEEGRQNVGRVSPYSADDGVGRLVQTQLYNEGLDRFEPDVDLEIALWDEQFEQRAADPFIPGYRLAFRDGSHYGFYRDPDGDPYAKPLIPLTAEQQQKLQDIATRLGMTGLATAAAANPDLTVEDLRQLLEDNTFYAFKGEGRDLPDRFEGKAVDDFASLVAEDGRMPQQCTPTIWFQKALLEELFGPGTAATTNGFVISGGGIVSKVRHGQTVFTYGGRTYILEAQPQVEEDGRPLTGGIATGRASDGGGTAPPRPRLADITVPERTAPSMIYDPEAQRERQLEAAFDTLEAQLSVLFRIPNREALRERLVQLSPDDPIRRAYEFAWRAAMVEDVTEDEAAALARYLELYKQASSALRKEVGVPSYDPRIITQVTDAVASINLAVAALREFAPGSGTGAAAEGLSAGGIDVTSVRDAIEAALALLPGEELVIARDGLAGAIAQLRESLSGSGNPAAAAAIVQLDAAQAALDRAARHTGTARDSSQGYLDGL